MNERTMIVFLLCLVGITSAGTSYLLGYYSGTADGICEHICHPLPGVDADGDCLCDGDSPHAEVYREISSPVLP